MKFRLKHVWILLLCSISMTVYAQQHKWILPVINPGNIYNDQIPMIDFTSGTPTYSLATVPNYYSSQTVGNGEYCNNCSSNPALISDFFITGHYDDTFNTNADNPFKRAVMATYETTGDCVPINYTLQDPLNLTAPDLTHESLAEVSVGAGQDPGTFWVVAQNSPDNQAGPGDGFFVYLMDFDIGVPFSVLLDVDPVLDAAYTNVHDYYEGVALGPLFTYDASLPGANPLLAGLNGQLCRSIYVIAENNANEQRMYHVILDVNAQQLYASDVDTGSTGYGDIHVLEIELSFPQSGQNNNHPQFVGSTGWNGTTVSELDGNGDFTGSIVGNLTTLGRYGIEFSDGGQYFYYSRQGGGSSNTSIDIMRYDLFTFPAAPTTLNTDLIANFSHTLTCATYLNCVMESASDGHIYVLDQRSVLYDMPNPNSNTVAGVGWNVESPAVHLEPGIASAGIDVCDLWLGLPDWVDGEDPKEVQGRFIEICINTVDCDEVQPVQVDVSIEGFPIQTVFIMPGDCERVFVCPNPDHPYDISLNNGQQVESVFVLQDYISVNFTVGSTTSTGPNSTAVVVPASTINTDEVWNGKIIVTGEVIVTNGAILDITNTDVLFHPCAGITFENGAILRANNSVFRPCYINDTWRGLRFDGTTNNFVNECTFKNANNALRFENGADGVVSSGLFANCYVGINVLNHGNGFAEAISGNRFVIDNLRPDFGVCDIFYADDLANFGIQATDAIFNAPISQNEFINAYNLDNALLVTGIQSSAVLGFANLPASENTFTDMFSSIVANGLNSPSYIENNEIEINRDYIGLEYQISLFNVSANTSISYNELTSSLVTGGVFTSAGIYIDGSNGTLVKSNDINGYSVGIQLSNSAAVTVVENHLKDCLVYGIYTASNVNNRVDISCNEIDLDDFFRTIGIGAINLSSDSYIHSNCVKDADLGMITFSNLGATPLPVITNNYFYNYRRWGILNFGHSGSIGTNVDPGMNTLWSNNNGATDIASTTNITVADNFGMFNITFGTVTITSNNPYHSTASCGNQIFNMPSQGNLDLNLVCDNRLTQITPIVINGNGDIDLDDNYADIIGKKGDEAFGIAQMIVAHLNEMNMDAETVLSNLEATSVFSPDEMNFLRYSYHLHGGRFETANNYLQAIQANSTAFNDLIILEGIRASLAAGEDLNHGTTAQLEAISQAEHSYANLANAMLENVSFYHEPVMRFEPDEGLKAATQNVEFDGLMVYPNPVRDQLTLELILLEEEDYTVSIFDMTGRVVETFNVAQVAGVINLNVDFLRSGAYFITTESTSGVIQKARFIKE